MTHLHITESDGIYTIRQTLPCGDVVSMATRSRHALSRAFSMYARGEVINTERAIYGTMSKTRQQAKVQKL